MGCHLVLVETAQRQAQAPDRLDNGRATRLSRLNTSKFRRASSSATIPVAVEVCPAHLSLGSQPGLAAPG